MTAPELSRQSTVPSAHFDGVEGRVERSGVKVEVIRVFCRLEQFDGDKVDGISMTPGEVVYCDSKCQSDRLALLEFLPPPLLAVVLV